MGNKSIHHLSFSSLEEMKTINLSDFDGKKLLIVNVASRCGFTHQYEGLQKLAETYPDNLVVIGFPCNQFLFQETGSDSKIASFCSTKYGVTFPMGTKIKVKGRNQCDIYKWLTHESENGVSDFKVTWNFNKFLLNEKGELMTHFGSDVSPIDDQIISLINQ